MSGDGRGCLDGECQTDDHDEPAVAAAGLPAMAFRIGTGSWADAAYKALLPAPTGVAASERLRAYAARFNHAEVNATAYRTPSPAQVERWLEQTPGDFTFSVKLHQRFSQNPLGAGADDTLVRRTRESVAPLTATGRFTCFLLVLPATFAPKKHPLSELSELVQRLAPHPIAVELRHRDWVAPDQREETLAFFRQQGLVWVAVDMPQLDESTLMPAVDATTHPAFAYLRCHGRNALWPKLKTAAEKHEHVYSEAELKELATRARRLAQEARTVHVIANNHAHDYAPRAALALAEELLREAPPAKEGKKAVQPRRTQRGAKGPEGS